jgi:hypothetical protein
MTMTLRVGAVALSCAVLGGAAVTAVLPATAADVGRAAATNWSQVWRNELQPLADQRYYTKKKSDRRYARKPSTIRGVYAIDGLGEAGSFLSDSIAFGTTLSAAPTPHYIDAGDPVPNGCGGTAALPQADPGHLCVFETGISNASLGTVFHPETLLAATTRFGAAVAVTVTAPGDAYVVGTWAVGVG